MMILFSLKYIANFKRFGLKKKKISTEHKFLNETKHCQNFKHSISVT